MDQLERRVMRAASEAMAETAEALIEATPVVTGRTVAQWRADDDGDVDGGITSETDPHRTSTSGEVEAALKGADPGDELIVANPAPWLGDVADLEFAREELRQNFREAMRRERMRYS